MHARRLVAATALILASLVATTASAQSDRQRAAQLAEDAGAAFEAGDVDAAIALYEEAFGLVPDPSFAYNLGGLCDATGDLPCAQHYFTRYIELFPGAGDRDEIEAYLDDLQGELEANYTRVTVGSDPEGAEVWLLIEGGSERLLGETPVDAWVAPGTIDIEVRAEGYTSARERRNGLAGLVVPIDLELEPIVAETPVVPPTEAPGDDPVPVQPPPPDRGGNGLGIALTSAGGAALVGGAVVFAIRGGTVSDHNALVAGIGSESGDAQLDRANRIDGLRNDAETLAGVGYATIGVGAALTGVGLVMLLRNGGAESDTSVSAGPTRDGFGVSLRTRF